MLTQEIKDKIDQILQAMPMPPGVTGYRFILDETPFGEPAVTIRFVVADDQLNNEWQRQHRFELFQAVWQLLKDNGLEEYPFISFTNESDNPPLLITGDDRAMGIGRSVNGACVEL